MLIGWAIVLQARSLSARMASQRRNEVRVRMAEVVSGPVIETVEFEPGTIILIGVAPLCVDGRAPSFRLYLNGVEAQPNLSLKALANQPRVAFRLAAPCGGRIFSPPPRITLHAACGDAGTQPVPFHEDSYYPRLNAIFREFAAFRRYVQDPGTRIRHEGTLAYLAALCCARYRRQADIQAASLCILAWRVFAGGPAIAEPDALFRVGARSLGRLDGRRGFSFDRWHNSLAQALAFLALQYDRADLARVFFERIVQRTAAITGTWDQAPNGVTARFMLGYLDCLSERHKDAAGWMTELISYFEERVSFFRVINHPILSELSDVARTVQQALIIRERLRPTPTDFYIVWPDVKLELDRIAVDAIRQLLRSGRMPLLRFPSPTTPS